MSKVFYPSEIIQFAIEKEQQSVDLYQKLANRARNDEEKALFEKLARDELHHKQFYADILSSVAEEKSPGEQEENEYAAYMRQLIEESRTVKLPDDIDTMPFNDILAYAIKREKDSVMFYLGLKQYVPADAQAKVEIIIAEESRHAAVIANLRRA